MTERLKPLAVGETHQFTVCAKDECNSSGMELEPGSLYRFKVVEYTDWRDACISTEPDGFNKWWLTPFVFFRRFKKAKWFKLVGAVGKSNDELFPIGKADTYTSKHRGELFAFTNDAWGFYRNNHGTLTLAVARVD